MATASNGRFLAVVQPIRLENTGWEIRIRHHLDYSRLITVLTDWVSFSFSQELNGSGMGSITLNLDTQFFKTRLPGGSSALAILDREYLFEAWENGTLRFQWLARNVEEQPVATNEDRTVTISGPGAADVLKNAKVLRPGWPKPVPKKVADKPDYGSGNDNSPAYKWIFPLTWPVMRMWYTLLKSAQKRGTVPWVKPMFTATHDSGGAKWVFVPTNSTNEGEGFSPAQGMDLWDFLQDCTGQDYSQYWAEYCEWIMWPGFKLDVRPTIGYHREKRVVFHEGALHDVARTRNREEISNVIIVRDNTFRDSHVTGPTSIKKWHRREYYYEQAEGTATTAARRTAIARNLLKQRQDEKSEWTITVPAFEQFRRPFYDYRVGDWIGISRHHNGTNTVAAYRVLAMTINVQDETPTVELTLQSEIQYRQAQLQKQLTWIIHKVSAQPQKPTLPTKPYDPNNPYGTIGYAQDIRVFIQPTDPGEKLARPGDFWYDTSYTLGNSYVYNPPLGKQTFNWISNNPADYTPVFTYVPDNLGPAGVGENVNPYIPGNLNPNVAQ